MRLGRGDRMNAVSHRRRAQVGSIVDRAGAVTCQGRSCTARKGSSVPYFDLSAAELEAYVPQINEPTDFDAFWAITLEESRVAGWEPRLTPVDSALRSVDVFDVFRGQGLDQGEKSVALSLIFQSDTSTLDDDAVEGITTAIIDALRNETGAQLRGM